MYMRKFPNRCFVLREPKTPYPTKLQEGWRKQARSRYLGSIYLALFSIKQNCSKILNCFYWSWFLGSGWLKGEKKRHEFPVKCLYFKKIYKKKLWMNTIGCKVTVDNWFLRRKGFGKILQKCNSYYVYRLKFNYYCKLHD